MPLYPGKHIEAGLQDPPVVASKLRLEPALGVEAVGEK
jgi:hypothetical protein